MLYHINYCIVVGVKTPGIIVRGWVSKRIKHLKLVAKNGIVWEQKFGGTRQVNGFEINVAIPECTFVQLIACEKEKTMVLAKIPAHFGVRLWNRVTRQHQKIKEQELDGLVLLNPYEGKTYQPLVQKEYNEWLEERGSNVQEAHSREFAYNPKISLVIPVYNVEKVYLSQCLDSILAQTYQNFEICLADDCSTSLETLKTLADYEKQDGRIKVCYRKENGHISLATNSAIALATGEYIGLMDNDDYLVENALEEVVSVLNNNQNIDFIYTDEDKLEIDGERSEPHFKPDFAMDNFMVSNYICHFSVIRSSIIQEIQGFRKGFEGAQDYDLFLRVIEKTKQIYHIPEILYRWRKIPGSTAAATDNKGYAAKAGQRSLEEFLQRNHIKAQVLSPHGTMFCVCYQYEKKPLVDIVIMHKGSDQQLYTCIDHLLINIEYERYQVVVFAEKGTTPCDMTRYQKVIKVRWIEQGENFNQYVEQCDSECLVFWNEQDTLEMKEWLDTVVSYAMHDKIGAAGSNVLGSEAREYASGYVIADRHKAIPVRQGYIAMGEFPVNRSLVGKAGYAVSRDHYIAVGGFDYKLAGYIRHFDLQMRLLHKYGRNIVAAQVYYVQKEEIGWQEFIPDISSMEGFVADPFYNPNLSTVIAYQLDKLC